MTTIPHARRAAAARTVAVAALLWTTLLLAPAGQAAAPVCGGPDAPPHAAFCPPVGLTEAPAVAACQAYGALVLPHEASPLSLLAEAEAQAWVPHGNHVAFDADATPDFGFGFVEARNLHAACYAESHLHGRNSVRITGGMAGVERLWLRYGFGELIELRSTGYVASISHVYSDPVVAVGFCEMGYSSRPGGFFGSPDLPCPPLDTGTWLPGVRVAFEEEWGPVAVPGTDLEAHGGAAVHIAIDEPTGGTTHVYLGVVVTAVAPWTGEVPGDGSGDPM